MKTLFIARDFGPSGMLKMIADYVSSTEELVETYLRTDKDRFPDTDFNKEFPKYSLSEVKKLFVGIHAFNNEPERKAIFFMVG